MKDDHIDLDELSLIWKSDTPPVPQKFTSRVQLTRLKMYALAAIETLIATIGSGFAIYLLATGSFLLGLTILAFCLASLGISFWSRSGAWRISTGSVKAELQTSIKQTRAQYKWAWGGIWICSFALLFLAVIAYLFSTNQDTQAAEFSRFFQYFSFTLVFVALNLAITSVILEKSRKKLFKLKLLYEKMVD